MSRPPLPLRVFILIAATSCLLLAMCAHSPPARGPVPARRVPAPVVQASQAPPPPDAAPPRAPEPTYFPATKAPPELYR